MTQSRSWLIIPSASSLHLAQPVMLACGHLNSSMLPSTRSATENPGLQFSHDQLQAYARCPSDLLHSSLLVLYCIVKVSLRSQPQVTSRVVSLAWTNDGQFLALGLYDGHISIRSRVGEEITVIQRDAPVWALSWNPNRYITSCWLRLR